jgi:hypothetical protein
MIESKSLPEPEKVRQTVNRLRRTRLAMEEAVLELDRVTSEIELENTRQRIERIQGSSLLG